MRKLLLLLLFLSPYFLTYAQQASIWDRVPEEVSKTNPFKRFEWFYRQRALPYDTIPLHTYITERDKEIQKIKNGTNVGDLLPWVSVGPNGIQNPYWCEHWGVSSGRVRAVAVHPNDPLTVYIGAASGGIWKTTNGGENWSDIGSDLESLLFGAIAIDPNNPNIVYVGSGEIIAYLHRMPNGRGLFKSTDAGASWTQINNGIGDYTHFGDLAVNPHNSNIVLAALGSGYFFTGNMPNEGIWKSTDNGETWVSTLSLPDAFDIVFHPSIPNLVYAALGGFNNSSGFYISTDAGDTWTQSNSGLQPPYSIVRMQIDISQSSPNILYGFIYDGQNNTPKVYKTTDGGNNWNQISAGVMLSGYGGGGYGWYDQGYYDLCIAVDPINPDHVIVGNVELHETANGSDFSVRRIPGGSIIWDSPVHVDYHKLVFAPSNPNYLYIGNDGGIYKSTDAGVTFSSINNGISTIQFYNIGSSPFDPSTMIGGAQDNFSSMTFDLGQTPWKTVESGDGMICFFDYEDPLIVYASAQYGYLSKSTDGGQSFFNFANIDGTWTTPFFLHPTIHTTIYAANRSVLRSNNGGSSWETLAENVTADFIYPMTQSSVNPDNMILAGSGRWTTNPEIKISSDGGFNWTDVTNNVPGAPRYISSVVTHPSDANTMYIVRQGFSAGNKVYKTTDLGVTWINISGDLPDLPCSDLFIDPYNKQPNNTNHLYIGTDIGVYQSIDGGATWSFASEGIPFVPVTDFDYVRIGNTGKLRVATFGRSAYETDFIVPVELVSFTGRSESGKVVLEWKTATETNNLGFEIERKIINNHNNGAWIRIAFKEGVGTSTQPQNYNYIDDISTISGSSLQYRLKQIDYDGTYEYSNEVSIKNPAPSAFELAQNYPNPFNPITMIRYSIPEKSNIKLTIINFIGEEIVTLLNETKEAGSYEKVWNATGLPSGVYIYKFQAGNFIKTKKMVLMK
jgi:photosystem II stability/assembly factor-like uncharacterized protein